MSSEYFNDPMEYAEKYEEMRFDDVRCIDKRYIPELIKQNVEGTLTLDYGCGPGRTTPYLKSLGLNVEGVDVNPHMIEIAQRKDPSGRYELVKSGEIEREDNYYDLVFSRWALVYAESKAELEKICREVSRVLKKNGTFILVVNSDETYSNKEWIAADTRFEQNKHLSSGSIAAIMFKTNKCVVFDHYWTEEDYFEVLTSAGFTVTQKLKPLGVKENGYAWVDEMHSAYATIYVARKL